MKIKVNKKSASIQFESFDELDAMRELLENYMNIVFESGDSHPDKLAKKLDEKFNKGSYEN